MPKLDLDAIPRTNKTGYPAEYAAAVKGTWKRRVGQTAGLTALGATHVTLEPRARSSQRHWHNGEDEVLVMLSGEAVLIENDGRTPVKAGDICTWPMNKDNGHQLINESDEECRVICFSAGDRMAGAFYPDIDMIFSDAQYRRKDGTPYPATRLK